MQTPLDHNCKLTKSMMTEVGKHHGKAKMLDFIFEIGYLTHAEFLPILEQYLPQEKWLPEFFLDAEDYTNYKELTKARTKALAKANATFNRNKRESDRIVITSLPSVDKKPKMECVGCGHTHFMYDYYCKALVCRECLAIQTKQRFADKEYNVASRMQVLKVNPVVLTYSRLATFVFFVRRYQGLCPLKASPEELDNIRKILLKEYGSLDNLSFKNVKLLLYKLKYNHLYSGVYTLLHELGSSRNRYSYAQIDQFKSQFSLWEDSGENAKHKSNLNILYAIATKLSIPFIRDV